VSLPLDRKTAEDQLLLKGMPQANLQCQRSGVTDLSPLKDLPLTRISCNFQSGRDAKILRDHDAEDDQRQARRGVLEERRDEVTSGRATILELCSALPKECPPKGHIRDPKSEKKIPTSDLRKGEKAEHGH
jgi:hypothetical protein